ncbi:amidohydrolase family protein [Saccharopolyspora sp. K220]|uniref:amidohydrolase family protein n=1 Tax=Saccharopolyspora soli TaxID=2926618 RepID=UPI001F5A786D|nr:amidohydrolase family protein [Saccharopolyspora soli]MCI2415874.1 amidohydrolase family protein [Saccharopolyspora soli]
MDTSRLTAIDVHAHVLASVAEQERTGASADSLAGVFGSIPELTVPELADFYRERQMAAVVFTVDSITRTGDGLRVSNEEIAEQAAEHQDTLIPFASVDPGRGAAGVRMARRLISDHGVRGFKFHPSSQAFYPNDPAAYPLYEVIAEAGLPTIFHSGQTAVGAGQRGGGGIRLKYSNPIHLDDVAVDFPDMPIIIAHPSVPWQDEALAVAGHKPQVYIDLSGWSPKYFPPQLVVQANSLLKHKMLFGSDFPALSPDRWLRDFAKLDLKDEVRPLILKENAIRLFGLDAAKEG